MDLDYQAPKRRTRPRQLWFGITLWLLIALLPTTTLLALWVNRHDPNAWR